MTTVSERIAGERSRLIAWLDELGLWETLGVGPPQGLDVRPLEGGLMNRVWVIEILDASHPMHRRAFVIKQALDALRVSPEVQIEVSRIAREHDALCWFMEALGEVDLGLGWRLGVPRPLAFYTSDDLLVMEHLDVSCDLEGWGGDSGDLEPLLETLGHTLALVHDVSATSPLADAWQACFAQPGVQRVREVVQYRAIRGWLDACHAFDASTRERVGDEVELLARTFLEPGHCLIMGDLWPRALLIDPSSSRASLIDWEFVHWGSPAQDVGHLLAHLWMKGQVLDDPEWARCAAGAFLEGYFSTLARRGADERLWRRDGEVTWQALTHAGAEILARVLGPFRVLSIYAEGAQDVKKKRAIAQAVSMIVGAREEVTRWRTHDCLLAWI